MHKRLKAIPKLHCAAASGKDPCFLVCICLAHKANSSACNYTQVNKFLSFADHNNPIWVADFVVNNPHNPNAAPQDLLEPHWSTLVLFSLKYRSCEPSAIFLYTRTCCLYHLIVRTAATTHKFIAKSNGDIEYQTSNIKRFKPPKATVLRNQIFHSRCHIYEMKKRLKCFNIFFNKKCDTLYFLNLSPLRPHCPLIHASHFYPGIPHRSLDAALGVLHGISKFCPITSFSKSIHCA